MSILKRAAVIFCALAVIISANGISIRRHYCSMAGNVKQTLFHEMAGAKASCCCSCKTSLPPAGTSIHKTPCCKSKFSLLKLPVFNDYRNHVASTLQIIADVPDYLVTLTAADNNNFTFITDYRPPPPLLAGRILLRFIHQLKFHLS
jgi:hypothetical protein